MGTSFGATADISGSDPRIARLGAPSRAGLALAAANGAAFLLLFGPSMLMLVRDWVRSPEYGHGLIVAPIAVWLAWRRRVAEPDPSFAAGLTALALGIGLFLAGHIAAELFTQRLGWLVSLIGLTMVLSGRAQLRAWWLPLCLVLLCLPIPEIVLSSATLPLQLLASRVAVSLLEFRHVPAELAGNVILLPDQQLFVAEACSGLRSLSALLTLTLLASGTLLTRPMARLALMAFAIPAALAANALRVFATGYGVYYLGPSAATGVVHEMAGMAVFAAAAAAVGIVAILLRRAES